MSKKTAMAASKAGEAATASPKKRKRENGESDPDRSQELSQGTEKQRLRFTTAEVEQDWQPVIVSTPGLNYNSKESLRAFKKGEELLLSSSSHPKLDYISQHEASGSSDDLMKHYLGIYDPTSGEVQVVPAKKLVMRSALRDGQTLEDDVADVLPATRRNAQKLLGEAFGTKKSKKAIRALADNAVNSAQITRTEDGIAVLDNVASAVLTTMTSVTASMPSRQSLQQDSDQSKPRPHMNLNAEEPKDVFSVDDLVGADIYKFLDTRLWAQAVEDGEQIHLNSAFVAHCVAEVMREEDLGETYKDKALLYFLDLLRWIQFLRKDVRGGWKLKSKSEVQEKLGDIPERVLDQIRRKFAADGQVNRWYQEYLYAHLCALALVIRNYKVEFSDLLQDFRIDRAELQKYFLELGCHIEKPGARSELRWAVLKIPMKFPKLRTATRKR